jgi:PAS domain S-box-containing protein
MPISSPGFIWGLIAAITVLLILSVGVCASAIIHGRKIRESESKFKLLFEDLFDPLVVVDREFEITDVNKATRNLLNYPKRELLGVALSQLISPDKWPSLQADLKKSLEENLTCEKETELCNRNGDLIQAKVGCTALGINNVTYVLVCFHDMRELKQAENFLKEKNIALKEVLVHLEEEKMSFKSQIAQTIDEVLIPTLNRVKSADGSLNESYYRLLHSALKEMATSSGGFMHSYTRLTPREIEICNLVRNGATSKEVARALNISKLTVNKHRERIRKKLIISGKEVNLTTFLQENGRH